MKNNVKNEKCNYCGGMAFKKRRLHYIYSREGKNLYVPDMPAEVCLTCGMVYYDGAALLEVERRFNAIYHDHEKPEQFMTIPVMSLADLQT